MPRTAHPRTGAPGGGQAAHPREERPGHAKHDTRHEPDTMANPQHHHPHGKRRRERQKPRQADGRRTAAQLRLAHQPRRLFGIIAERNAGVARAHEGEQHDQQQKPEERITHERTPHATTRGRKMLARADRRLRQKPERRKPAQPEDDRGQTCGVQKRRERKRNCCEQGQMCRQPILGKELLQHQPRPITPDDPDQ